MDEACHDLWQQASLPGLVCGGWKRNGGYPLIFGIWRGPDIQTIIYLLPGPIPERFASCQCYHILKRLLILLQLGGISNSSGFFTNLHVCFEIQCTMNQHGNSEPFKTFKFNSKLTSNFERILKMVPASTDLSLQSTLASY